MKPHTRIYLRAAGLSEGEPVYCEICGSYATDTHHIHRRGIGGSKTANDPSNLMALCRECHDRYGDRRQYVEMLQEIHNSTMAGWPKQKGGK